MLVPNQVRIPSAFVTYEFGHAKALLDTTHKWILEIYYYLFDTDVLSAFITNEFGPCTLLDTMRRLEHRKLLYYMDSRNLLLLV